MAGRRASYFAVTREAGAAWDPALPLRRQIGWEEHAAFMDALAEEGFIVLGGPVDGGPTTLLVVEAESAEAVEARLAEDPWTPTDLLRIVAIQRWQVLLRRPPTPG